MDDMDNIGNIWKHIGLEITPHCDFWYVHYTNSLT